VGPVSCPELGHNVSEVILHSPLADVQSSADELIRMSFSHRRNNLHLTVGQRVCIGRGDPVPRADYNGSVDPQYSQ